MLLNINTPRITIIVTNNNTITINGPLAPFFLVSVSLVFVVSSCAGASIVTGSNSAVGSVTSTAVFQLVLHYLIHYLMN